MACLSHALNELLSKSLKRKVDSENRAYKDAWKYKYAFILPSFVNAKKTCMFYLQWSDPQNILNIFQNFSN